MDVVERIDIVSNRSGRFRASFKGLMVEHLAFDRREKALSDRIDAPMFVNGRWLRSRSVGLQEALHAGF
jgi:hypothetical protein